MQYNALAESEELSTSHGDGDQHFDRFDLMDGVLALPTSEESCVFASPRPLATFRRKIDVFGTVVNDAP